MNNDYTEILPDGTPLEMVFVEGGSFMMGSKEYSDEQPIHKVTCPDFYLGKYPVTNAQLVPFLNEMGNQEERGEKWVNLDGAFLGAVCGIIKEEGRFQCKPGLEHHPAIYINWRGANAYCKWLSQKSGHEYGLPSESCWEYAAKGGKQGKAFKYAGSNKLKEVGWYDTNSNKELKKVGQKLPNTLGLYDMSGNVREWCADHWHKNYEGAPVDGSVWKKEDENSHVDRGGSWGGDNYDCRVSVRSWNYHDYRNYVIGFRVSRY